MLIFKTKSSNRVLLPFYNNFVKAGFPSPADDYISQKLDLNEYLIQHPSSTFLVKVEGESMTGAGIFPGDLLIVDRSQPVKDSDVILAIISNEFTVKRFRKIQGKIYLVPENPDFKPIEITQETEFEVWGVVTSVIHKP